jgi:PAS domain S-box-containing protein
MEDHCPMTAKPASYDLPQKAGSSEEKSVKEMQTKKNLLEKYIDYRELIDKSSCIVLEWDTEGKVLFLNSYGLEFFGFTEEEILGRNVIGTIVAPVDSAGLDLQGKMNIVEKHPDDFVSSENENIRKNGEKVWVAWTNKGIYDTGGKLLKTISFGIDRTQPREAEKQLQVQCKNLQQEIARRENIEAALELSRRDLERRVAERTRELTLTNRLLTAEIGEHTRAEENLFKSEKKFSSVFHLNPNPMAIIDMATADFLDVNEAFTRWSGYSRRKVIGFRANEISLLVNPEDRRKIMEALVAAEEINGREIMVRLKNSSVRYVLFSARIIQIEQERYLLALANDITERKKAEEKYRDLFENIQEGIFQSTPEGKFNMANQSIARMLGYDSPEDLIACVTDVANQLYVEPGDRAKLVRIMETQDYAAKYEARFYKKDGGIIWVALTTRAVRNEKGKVLYYEGIVADITEKKQSVERLRGTLEGTVRAIASIVETRDPYTAGHQRRVSDLARAIAEEMGLSEERVEGLHVAATIHDIGKISVPAEMLTKPTRLTKIEFSLIQTHVQAGYDILKDIVFPWPVARMVVEHHERMNGTGYPNALKGDNILLESRIMAVADVVEAMASHRPYRASLGIEPALEEIEKNRGILYDAEAVDACLILFKQKGYKLE